MRFFFPVLFLFFTLQGHARAQGPQRPAGSPEQDTAVDQVGAYISWFKRNVRPSKRQAAILLAPEIVKAARAHGLDPFLVATTARFESSFWPSNPGKKGEFGLMQVMRLHTLASEAEQLDRGAAHLARSLKKCGSVEGAISHYMGGPCRPPLKRARGRFRHFLWAKGRFSK